MTTVGTHQVGDRVRYVGTYKTGTVQSTWWVRGQWEYVVTWVTGQSTTVPAEWLLPVQASRATRVVPWLVWTLLGLLMAIGVALPLIGWVTVVPFAAWAMHRYATDRRRIRDQEAGRVS